MALRKKGNVWYVYYVFEGKINSRSLKTTDKKEAVIRERKFMNNLRLIRYEKSTRKTFQEMLGMGYSLAQDVQSVKQVQPLSLPPASETDVNPLVSKMLTNDRQRLKLKDMYETAKRHKPDLSHEHELQIATFNGFTDVKFADEVTPKIALEFLEKTYGNKKAKTYNNALTRMNIVFELTLIESGLTDSPFAHIFARPVKDATHHRDFSIEECKKIIANACPYWSFLSKVAFYTGQRLETCQRLAPCHVDWKENTITILPGKTARFGRSVRIPILPELAKALKEIQTDDDDKPYCKYFESVKYWRDENGYATERLYFSGLLDSLGIKAENSESVGFHSFRCSFITIMSENGIDEKVIRGIVGHADSKMTDLYNHDTKSAKSILKVKM